MEGPAPHPRPTPPTSRPVRSPRSHPLRPTRSLLPLRARPPRPMARPTRRRRPRCRRPAPLGRGLGLLSLGGEPLHGPAAPLVLRDLPQAVERLRLPGAPRPTGTPFRSRAVAGINRRPCPAADHPPPRLDRVERTAPPEARGRARRQKRAKRRAMPFPARPPGLRRRNPQSRAFPTRSICEGTKATAVVDATSTDPVATPPANARPASAPVGILAPLSPLPPAPAQTRSLSDSDGVSRNRARNSQSITLEIAATSWTLAHAS